MLIPIFSNTGLLFVQKFRTYVGREMLIKIVNIYANDRVDGLTKGLTSGKFRYLRELLIG
jgi:hypothetical protein